MTDQERNFRKLVKKAVKEKAKKENKFLTPKQFSMIVRNTTKKLISQSHANT